MKTKFATCRKRNAVAAGVAVGVAAAVRVGVATREREKRVARALEQQKQLQLRRRRRQRCPHFVFQVQGAYAPQPAPRPFPHELFNFQGQLQRQRSRRLQRLWQRQRSSLHSLLQSSLDSADLESSFSNVLFFFTNSTRRITGLLLYLKNLGIDWKILQLFLKLLFKDQQNLFFQVLKAPT